MKRTVAPLLIVALLLITAQRLPAPIQEEATPTPTVRPKPKPPAAKHTPSPPERRPASPFAGTWEGPATYTCSDEGTGNWPLITVLFNSDAKTVRTKWVVTSGQLGGPFVTACAASGGVARWNYAGVTNDHLTSFSHSVSMQILDSRTAALSVHIAFTSGPAKGSTCNVAGTLIRQ